MKANILKIISGGQTGADIGGLNAALALKIRTGGCAPKGFLTENGSNYELGIKYGMHQSTSDKYPVRTKENVSKSDATIIFSVGATERGSLLTKKECEKSSKPFLWVSPNDETAVEKVKEFIVSIAKLKQRAIILNIAGNRESKYPGISKNVEAILVNTLS